MVRGQDTRVTQAVDDRLPDLRSESVLVGLIFAAWT